MISAGLLFASVSFGMLEKIQPSHAVGQSQYPSFSLSQDSDTVHVPMNFNNTIELQNQTQSALENSGLTAHRGSGRNCATSPCS